MVTEAMDSSALLNLLRWRHTAPKTTKKKRDHEDDLILDHLLQFLDQESLSKPPKDRDSCNISQLSKRCNIPATRILHEIIKLAIHTLSQSIIDSESATSHSFRAIRLLHAAVLRLALVAEESSAMETIYIPVSACNLLLSVLSESVENLTIAFDVLSFLLDYNSSDTFSQSFCPRFSKYKPTISVWMGFTTRAFNKARPRLSSSLENNVDAWVSAYLRLQLLLLTTLEHLQRGQTNKKKAFLTLSKPESGLLEQLFGFRHFFRRFSRSEREIGLILKKLDAILVEGLLDDSILCEFDGACVYSKQFSDVTPRGNSKKQKTSSQTVPREVVSYPHNLFDALLALIRTKGSGIEASMLTDWQDSMVTVFDLLSARFTLGIRRLSRDKSDNNTLLKGRKRSRHILASSSASQSPFRFWAELCGVVFAVSVPVSLDDISPLLAGLFAVLRHADIYRITEDTDDKRNLQVLQKIFSMVLTATKDLESISEVTSKHICSIIADATQCVPNLIGTWLPTVVHQCGRMHATGSASSASHGMACVLKAYESMRLLQDFWSTCFQVADDANCNHLRHLLESVELKSAISHCFSRLPPGQMDPFWSFCIQSFQSACESSESTLAALIRMVFDSFLSQLHVTPDNRTAFDALMLTTFDQISPFKEIADAISSSEVETLALFGSLTSLYTDISESVSTSTFDRIPFSGSISQRLCGVLDTLTDDSSSNGGILRLCTHWLHIRKEPEACALGRHVTQFVLRTRSWNRIIYSLGDLASLLPEDLVDALLSALILAFVHEDDSSDAHPRGIFQDASFYEIVPFHKVMLLVLDKTAQQLTSGSPRSLSRFYGLLLSFPDGYLSGSVLSLLRSSMKLQMSMDERSEAWVRLTEWISKQLGRLCDMASPVDAVFLTAMEEFTAFHLGRNGSQVDLMQRIIAFCCRNDPAGLQIQLEIVSLESSATLIEIFARLLRHKAIDTKALESNLIQKSLNALKLSPADNSIFSMVHALMEYWLAIRAERLELASRIRAFLPCVGEVFQAAMRELLTTQSLTAANLPAWKLFLLVCENYSTVYETYRTRGFGRLLAASLSLMQVEYQDVSFQQDCVTSALLGHAHVKEFHLFVSTSINELSSSQPERVFASLRLLHAAFFHAQDNGYKRKLSGSRRDEVSPYKMRIIEQCVGIFGRCLIDLEAHLSTSILLQALRLFASLFCTPEMFSWKAHELPSILLGFQPIQTLVECKELLPVPLMDRVYWHSYMLLLRVVRHHFNALVSSIPQLILASSSLLRVLVKYAERLHDNDDYHLVEQWASNLTRLYGYIKTHDVSFRKHIVYLLMESLSAFSDTDREKLEVASISLRKSVQEKLQAGHFALLDACSSYEKEQLFLSLNASGKSIFRQLDAAYNSTHRFQGKI